MARAFSWISIVVGAAIVVVSILKPDMSLFWPNILGGALLVIAAGYVSWGGAKLSKRARGMFEGLCAVVGLGLAFVWITSEENVSLRPLMIFLAVVAFGVGAVGAVRALQAGDDAPAGATPSRMRWLSWTLAILAVLAVLYGGFVAYAESSNGTTVNVFITIGTNPAGTGTTTMYLKCDAARSTAGVCSGGEQGVVTVHKRDRIHLTIHNDDAGDHTHDFNVEGWQYAIPPISPESEMHESDASWTFTAWAAGDFKMLCEISGHDAAGMHGTLKVL